MRKLLLVLLLLALTAVAALGEAGASDGTAEAASDGVIDAASEEVIEAGAEAGASDGGDAAADAGAADAGAFGDEAADAEAEPAPQKGLEVYYLDVASRVDAILIRCDGVTCFIDSGFRADAKPVLAYLKALGVEKLDMYIGTHAHADHVGGAATIIEAMRPERILIPHRRVWPTMLEDANAKQRDIMDGIGYVLVSHGDAFPIGGAAVKCLGPVYVRNVDRSTSKENANSLILRLTYGAHIFLFTGDATDDELREANRQYPGELRADVFKSPHHNGDHADDVIGMVGPKLTVICTANENPPSGEYCRALKKAKSAVCVTGSDNDGNVLVTSDGSEMQVYRGYALDRVSLNPLGGTLTPGQSLDLTGTLEPASRANAKRWLNWRSSDPSVATVSGGTVTGVAEGMATITATSINGLSDAVEVQVYAVGLSLNKNRLSLKVGDAFQLKAKPSSKEARSLTGEWLSEDSSVAVVTAQGEVLAAGQGETRVIARLSNGAEAICQVEVVEKPVKSVALNRDRLSLSPGEQAQLTAEITPSDATDKRLEWASSDETVATVDAFGNVTAVGKGKAKIGVRASGGAYDLCEVRVK